MSHSFPPRKFAANEVADPDALNEVFQGIVSKIGGHLNEQDISTEIKTAPITVAAEAYYDGHHIKRAASPDWIVAAGFYASIDGAAANDDVVVVENATGWQQLVDQTGSQAMSLTITAGEGDTLVMIAQLQHVAWQGTDTTTAANINSPLRLQYSFRVDGAVLDDTITGAVQYPDTPPQQWYRATPQSSAASYDYRHIQYMQNTTGIAAAVHPTRLLRSVPVAAGSRVVEVVARRLPPFEYKEDLATVQVFNRRLFVLRIKGMSPHSGEVPSVNISSFDDGAVLAASDITTNGFTVLQTALNALDNAHLERGALHNRHLPSCIYGPVPTSITPAAAGAAIYVGTYPGYGSNAAGWAVVNDGAGTNLRITGPTAGEWDLAANPGTFVVLANIQVNYVMWIGLMALSSSNEAIGIFTLRYTNAAGTVTVLGECEVYVNGHNFTNDATPLSANIEDDIELMWVVDSTTLSAADKHITRVEVVCSVWDATSGAANTVQVGTQRGCIFGFVLLGVSL